MKKCLNKDGCPTPRQCEGYMRCLDQTAKDQAEDRLGATAGSRLSATPRTNEQCRDVDTYAGDYLVTHHPPVPHDSFPDPGGRWVEAEFAREMEMENTALREAIEAAKSLMHHTVAWRRSRKQDAAVSRWERALNAIPEND